MTALIDFSLFQYSCIDFAPDSERFTYKTNKNQVNKIIKEFFAFLKKLTDSKNIKEDFPTRPYHYYPVRKLMKKQLVINIFKKFGNYKDDFINQYLGDSPNIWEIKIGSERRMFFIQENGEQNLVIKPLFLDVNHIIFNDEKIPKNFHTCLVCWQNKCK